MIVTKEVVEKLVKKDEDTFLQLYNNYYRLAYKIVYSYFENILDVEELVQDIFLKVVKKIRTYNSNWEFTIWFCAICRNHCVDRLRKRMLETSLMELDHEFIIDDRDTKVVRILDDIKDRLKPKEYEIIFYYLVMNLSFQDIAKMKNYSKSGIRKIYTIAMTKLKAQYDNEEIDCENYNFRL